MRVGHEPPQQHLQRTALAAPRVCALVPSVKTLSAAEADALPPAARAILRIMLGGSFVASALSTSASTRANSRKLISPRSERYRASVLTAARRMLTLRAHDLDYSSHSPTVVDAIASRARTSVVAKKSERELTSPRSALSDTELSSPVAAPPRPRAARPRCCASLRG